jgi:hypothetical protein
MFTSSIILPLVGAPRVGDRSGAYTVLVGRPENMRHLVNLGVDGFTILKCIFNKWDVTGAGLIWLMIVTDGGLF